MDAFANALIDALGGTGKVAGYSKTPASTVSSWRRDGLTPARQDHLFRIAEDECPSVDVRALAAAHGVSLPNTASEARDHVR